MKVEELLSLLVLAPDPPAPAKGEVASPQLARWQAVIDKTKALMQDQFRRVFDVRRAAAEASRKNPPVQLRDAMFCGAAPLAPEVTDLGER